MLKRYYARELPASRTARGSIARQSIRLRQHARKFRTGGLNISPRVRHFGNFRARIVVN
jgi:hypothetical protein